MEKSSQVKIFISPQQRTAIKIHDFICGILIFSVKIVQMSLFTVFQQERKQKAKVALHPFIPNFQEINLENNMENIKFHIFSKCNFFHICNDWNWSNICQRFHEPFVLSSIITLKQMGRRIVSWSRYLMGKQKEWRDKMEKKIVFVSAFFDIWRVKNILCENSAEFVADASTTQYN